MSFSAVASYPNNKGSDLFTQGYEELSSDFFDEFLTFNDNEVVGYTNVPQSVYLETSANDSNSGGTSLSLTDDEAKQHTLWRGSLGAASSHASAQNHFYAELSGRAAISDSELLSLEGISLYSPQLPTHPQTSLPSSPTPAAAGSSRRKTRITESLSKSLKKATSRFDKALLQKPIRKAISPPKMRAAHHSETSFDAWGEKLQQDASKFNFDFHQNSRNLTPPLTCRISDVSMSTASTKREISNAFANNGTMLHRSAGPGNYSTPLTTPIQDHQSSRNSSSQYPSSSGPLFPITPHNQNVSGSWSQPPGSPPLNTYGGLTSYTDIEQPFWWNHASTAKMAQPAPSGYHINPQQATKNLAVQLQNGLEYDTNELAFDPSTTTSGLMIQIPGKLQYPYGMGSPPMQQGYFDGSRSQPQYKAVRRQYAPPPSRQPQLSGPVRKNRTGSSESESSSPKSPSSSVFHVRKYRSPKTNKHSTPPTPTLGAAVDFVNYTPSDRRKILTGVAPSGSSKTKARREKEAMEKRRKLSQAAVRAVRAAGGDIESLVEEGLFV